MDDEELNDGDVETLSKRGQWVNRVVGDAAESSSFASKEEAMEVGRLLATERGTRHVVRNAQPTGAITDEDPAVLEQFGDE
ncbi:MAG: hypothetical protein JWP30_944 [Homoserinimonas sp.]|nr:hypothetical protein [Homoserinimonas sp.]